MKRITSGGFAALLMTSGVSAYELATHGELTQKAYERSALSTDAQLLSELGVDGASANPFGEIYYDVSGTEIRERRQHDFEKGRMPSEGRDFLKVRGWLLRGAIREDDYAAAFGVWVAPNPRTDQDPPEGFWRVMNHFFNPINRQPLTLSPSAAEALRVATGATDFRSAPNWALGTEDAFAPVPVSEPARRNHYTVLDAREAQYRALAGRRADDTPLPASGSIAERNKYWATTFRALGDVVHLIQDMAQPQHTRNDAHSGVPGYGHESVYEKYIDARATQAQSFKIDHTSVTPSTLDYSGVTPDRPNGIPLPRFSRYSDYWSSGAGNDVGEGLADYSNSHFFSAGKNLGNNEFLLPSNDPASYTKESAVGLLPALPLHSVNFLRGGPDNIRMTTESAFDAFLIAGPRSYTLNRYNYDAMASLLLPRAVAYSAGVIDYFFRGRLEVQDAGFTETGVILRVKNAIDAKKTPAWAGEYLDNGGKLVATLRYELPNPSDPEHPEIKLFSSPPVTLEERVNPGKASKQAYTLTALPEVPEEATNVEYRLVYRGRLGNEDDAIAVGTFKPVSGILVTVDGASSPKLIRHRHGAWRLGPESGLQAGNIDWKGWYQDGKATKVLSWQGSQARYFPDGEQYYSSVQRRYSWSFFEKEVYQDGAVFAVAPQPVLGASAVRDLRGDDWLVVICTHSRPSGGVDEVIYRRPYKKSASAALYDATQAPDGWQEIGRFDGQQTSGAGQFSQAPDTPWFFNGDGTEAQTMRRYWDAAIYFPDGLLKRLKLVISVDVTSANLVSLGNDAGFTDTYTCSDGYSTDPATNAVSGGGTRTVTSGGSYVVAVDYGPDSEPILARIEIAGGSSIENWSVSGPDGSHTLLGSYKELLTWNSGSSVEIMHDSTSGMVRRNWGPNAYISGIGSDWAQKEVSYLLDLRDQSYAFLNTEMVSTGSVYATLGTQGSINGYRVSKNSARKEASGRVRGAFIGADRYVLQNQWSQDTPLNGSPDYYSRCGYILTASGFFDDNATYHRYGTSNLGWWRADGSAVVDSQGQYAASWQAYSNSGYDAAGPVNEFSDQTSLEKLFPGVQQYYPIRLVR